MFFHIICEERRVDLIFLCVRCVVLGFCCFNCNHIKVEGNAFQRRFCLDSVCVDKHTAEMNNVVAELFI